MSNLAYKEELAKLKAEMDTAFEKGDLKAVGVAAKAMKALGDEEHKAEREAAVAEIDDLYEKVSKAVLKVVDKYATDLDRLQVKGFSWGSKHGPEKRKGFSWGGSALIRKGKGGGGGGGAGKTKTVYGQSLGEIFEANATPEEKAEFAEAQAIADLSERGNKTYQVKVAVKKRLIADGTLVPKS